MFIDFYYRKYCGTSFSAFTILSLFLLSVIGSFILLPQPVYGATDKIKEQIPSVRVVLSRKEVLRKWINTSGFLTPHSLVSITSLTEGYVPPNIIEIGSIVKKGQPMLLLKNKLLTYDLKRKEAVFNNRKSQLESLKHSSERAALLEVAKARRDYLVAKADLANAKLVYESKKKLGISGMLAGQELQVAQSDYDKAVANLDFLKAVLDDRKSNIDKKLWELDIARVESDMNASGADLEMSRHLFSSLNIEAPFDGQIVRRFVEEGNYIRTGAQLFELADISSLFCDCYLDERTLRSVQCGQHVELKLFDDDFSCTGQIEIISPVADLEKGGHLVRVKIASVNQYKSGDLVNKSGDSTSRGLALGGYFSCRILIRKKPGVVVLPIKSVLSKDSSPYVYVVTKDNIALKQPVQLGIEESGKIEIVSGLSVGKAVIVDGVYNVKDNQKVTLIQEAD